MSGLAQKQMSGMLELAEPKHEFKRFLGMAIGAASEMRPWLKYAADLDYSDASVMKDLRDQYQILLRMLQKLYGKIN